MDRKKAKADFVIWGDLMWDSSKDSLDNFNTLAHSMTIVVDT